MAKIGNQSGVNIPPPPFYATAKHWLRKMTHNTILLLTFSMFSQSKPQKYTILNTFTSKQSDYGKAKRCRNRKQNIVFKIVFFWVFATRGWWLRKEGGHVYTTLISDFFHMSKITHSS